MSIQELKVNKVLNIGITHTNTAINMANIAFIGGVSSGKTVTAGLLYEAVTVAKSGTIRDHDFYPSGEDIEDIDSWMNRRRYGSFNLEMGADEPTLKYLRDNVITPLRSGEWPGATFSEEFRLLRFDFSKRDIFRRKKPLGIYEIGGEKIAKIFEIIASAKDKGTILRLLRGEDVLHTLLQSDVFVVLMNSELCIPPSYKDTERAQKILTEQAQNDFNTALMLTAIRNYKTYMGGKIEALAMLFTKHDKVNHILPLNNRKQFEDAIRTTMRSTWTQNSYLLDEYKINTSEYFKSGVQTRNDEKENQDKPHIPLRFYVRDFIDLLYWLIKI